MNILKMKSSFDKIIYEATNKFLNNIITEASEDSIRQQYKNKFGFLIDVLLSLDKTPKKKITEWVLKLALKTENPFLYLEELLMRGNMLREMIYEAQKNEGYQITSYKNFDDAYEAYQNYQLKRPISPSYSDETIDIYVPEAPSTLRAMAFKLLGRMPYRREKMWCVISNETNRRHWWEEYTNNNANNLYLVHNKDQNKLYLWNNHPYKHEAQFQNWECENVSPLRDGQLTDGAIAWLNNHSGLDITGVKSYIPANNWGKDEYVFGGRYVIGDPTPEYTGDRWLNLYDVETDELVIEEFCRYRHSIDINTDNYCLITNTDWDYDIFAYMKNGQVYSKDIEDEDEYDELYEKLQNYK